MSFYKVVLRPLLFLLAPESAHHFVSGFLKFLYRIPGVPFLMRSVFCIESSKLKKTVFGIDFPNSVGLAAGFDKDAKLYDELSTLGFGFIEVGTVTPKPQPGNPKPRMFRLKADEALINRMGFNNEGVESMILRLRKRKSRVIIGGNIGKNKDTPNEQAIDDYEICFRSLFHLVDYFVVNVSSPNTAGLRDLQEKEPLLKILNRLQEINSELSLSENEKSNTKLKPLLLKISPDLGISALDEVIEVCLESNLDGIIATNTTISREHLKSSDEEIQLFGNGGLSGVPLAGRSTEIIRYIADKVKGRLLIIGVGGVHNPDDALEKLKAGASLIQLYTGFIYEGPSLVKKINKRILIDHSIKN